MLRSPVSPCSKSVLLILTQPPRMLFVTLKMDIVVRRLFNSLIVPVSCLHCLRLSLMGRFCVDPRLVSNCSSQIRFLETVNLFTTFPFPDTFRMPYSTMGTKITIKTFQPIRKLKDTRPIMHPIFPQIEPKIIV